MASIPAVPTSRDGNDVGVGGSIISHPNPGPSSTTQTGATAIELLGTFFPTASTQTASTTPPVVTFDSSPFIGQQYVGRDRVMRTDENFPPQILWWYANSSVTLDSFKWYVGHKRDDNPDQAFTGDRNSGHLEGREQVQAAMDSTRYTGSPLPDQGQVEGLRIDLAKFSTDENESLGKLMNIHVDWTSNGEKGYSISGAFSIVDNGNDQNNTGHILELNDRAGKLRATQSLAGTTINSSFEPSATSNSAPSAADVNPGTSSLDPNPGSDHGGGLSTGAKAGIGVACGVVGLALIAALVFFLMRRRRNNTLTPGHKDEQSTTAFVGDKGPHSATHTLNGGAPTHHSFRDDIHHHQQQMPLNGAAARTMDASHSSSDDAADPYHPYHDLPPRGAVMQSQPSGSRHDVSSLGGPETPSGVPHTVAHLVEDGMTEDDIRRLEREERELDDDLERAGRR